VNFYTTPVTLAEGVKTGEDRLVLLSGPCAVESYDLCLEVATTVADICRRLNIGYVFKASFDKANRTSATSFRGVGMDRALQTLERIKKEVGVPVITDIHESSQVAEVAQVVDVLQIPAFLCRQTDLLLAAGESGLAVNVKKGQFMAPEDMQYAADKVRETGNPNVLLCERGTTFGYHNLVVDMRALPIMRQYAPVIFDVTHSIQQPGGMGGSSGGQRQFASYLARAAAAVGVDGFFIETHPQPEKALSDGPNMIPLHQMEDFMKMLQGIWALSKGGVNS
jgi:2-dehydro-3-deoxyphosphooctonate aldolase (KDO 8-P synthase)